MRTSLVLVFALAACDIEPPPSPDADEPSSSSGGIRVPRDLEAGSRAELGDGGAIDAGGDVDEGDAGAAAAPGVGGRGEAGGAGAALAGAGAGAGGSAGGTAGSAGQLGTPECWADEDHDGFGDESKPLSTCPLGVVSKTADDCDDFDPDVKPGQTKLFDEPRANGSWDYNCNGLEDGNDQLGTCPDTSGDEPVPGSEGWVEVCPSGCPNDTYAAPPECGDEGAWKTNAAACPAVVAAVRRKCH